MSTVGTISLQPSSSSSSTRPPAVHHHLLLLFDLQNRQEENRSRKRLVPPHKLEGLWPFNPPQLTDNARTNMSFSSLFGSGSGSGSELMETYSFCREQLLAACTLGPLCCVHFFLLTNTKLANFTRMKFTNRYLSNKHSTRITWAWEKVQH